MKVNKYGKGVDKMPGLAFRVMSAMFWVRDKFISLDKLLDEFDIREGQTVVDFGCGPGTYIEKASALVGESGKVLAVDIHPLAIKAIEKRAAKKRLANITGHVAGVGTCPLADDTADVIYALDMFHMVAEPGPFLKELNRIAKPGSLLYIDDGHQPRAESKGKIAASGIWEIVTENKRFMKCRAI
ncbi:MAG: class I SAM-dependent methyltransferase [Proteobacteria bacterium]|nr:class I SAM-dependent methyltransferase [Pseudomonadota bacterium]